jgi:hypothetical protein
VRFRDLRIGTQLGLGLGLLLVLVIGLAGLAWRQGHRLWKHTEGIHDHPLRVRRAIGTLKSDILELHVLMRDLCNPGGATRHPEIREHLDVHQSSAFRQLEIIREAYLGPRLDVRAARESLVRWTSLTHVSPFRWRDRAAELAPAVGIAPERSS